MENLIFSANIVFPLFILIALGFLFRQIGWISEDFLVAADKLVFKVFLPAVLFNSIYTADISSAVNLKLMLYSILALVAVNFIAFIIVPLSVMDDARRGTLIQAMTRSNFILFAIPICQASYGTNGVLAVSVLAAAFVPISNFFAVLALSLFNSNGRKNFKDLILGILKNPFIIASLSAILINFVQLKFPSFAVKALKDIATMATPFALIVLGAQIKLKAVRNNLSAIFWTTAMKLIFLPAAVLLGAYCIGLRGLDFMILLAVFCAPIAVSTFSMAKMMNCDEELAAQLIVSTTFFSFMTIFAFLFLSRNLFII